LNLSWCLGFGYWLFPPIFLTNSTYAIMRLIKLRMELEVPELSNFL
jgi:hypothetical protein